MGTYCLLYSNPCCNLSMCSNSLYLGDSSTPYQERQLTLVNRLVCHGISVNSCRGLTTTRLERTCRDSCTQSPVLDVCLMLNRTCLLHSESTSLLQPTSYCVNSRWASSTYSCDLPCAYQLIFQQPASSRRAYLA
jgi:hypothetical protein